MSDDRDEALRTFTREMIAVIDRARDAGLDPVHIRSTTELLLHYARPRLDGPRMKLTVRSIAEFVAEHSGVTLQDLRGERQKRDIAWPRQVAMMLSMEMTRLSLTQVGTFFNRDHSTVVHAVRAVEKRLADGCEDTADLVFDTRRAMARELEAEASDAEAA